MNYAQVFDSLDALKDFMKAAMSPRGEDLPADYVKSMPYADFGKAVFGHYLFPASSGLGPMDPTSPEFEAALAAALPSASLIVWMKFGRELSESHVVFGTLAELNVVASADPPLIAYRQDGLPAAADYADASVGRSRTYTVSLESFKKTDRKLTTAAVSQYKNLDWRFLIGVMDMPAQAVVPSISVARPNL